MTEWETMKMHWNAILSENLSVKGDHDFSIFDILFNYLALCTDSTAIAEFMSLLLLQSFNIGDNCHSNYMSSLPFFLPPSLLPSLPPFSFPSSFFPSLLNTFSSPFLLNFSVVLLCVSVKNIYVWWRSQDRKVLSWIWVSFSRAPRNSAQLSACRYRLS